MAHARADGARTHFIVAGFPRTGSSLILLSLAQHPNVDAFGELFHPKVSQRERAGRTSVDPLWQDERENAIDFLMRSIWGTPGGSRPVAGFKLFTTHTHLPGTRCLFQRLHERFPDLRVIHSYRKNYLDAWVSLQKAEQTGVWARPADLEERVAEPYQSIEVDPNVLEGAFTTMKESDQLIETFHDSERYLRVSYEDLSARFHDTVASMHRFLRVPPMQVRLPLSKQNRETHRSFLLNYDELAKHFRETRYGWFFAE